MNAPRAIAVVTSRDIFCNDRCFTRVVDDCLSLGNDVDFDGSLEKRNYLEARDFIRNYDLQTSNCPLFWNIVNALSHTL
jgi:hypothetical protein